MSAKCVAIVPVNLSTYDPAIIDAKIHTFKHLSNSQVRTAEKEGRVKWLRHPGDGLVGLIHLKMPVRARGDARGWKIEPSGGMPVWQWVVGGQYQPLVTASERA